MGLKTGTYCVTTQCMRPGRISLTELCWVSMFKLFVPFRNLSPPRYCHLVVTTKTCMVGKRVLHILLECCLVTVILISTSFDRISVTLLFSSSDHVREIFSVADLGGGGAGGA